MASAFNPLQLASFNGTSQFAGDLQNAINHAVSVASIPITQLGTNATQLQNQQTELSTLQSKFAAIQTAIQSLSSANGGSLTSSESDNTVASVSVDSSAALAGAYTLNVINPGAQTLTLSNTGATVTDPSSTSLSTSATFTLTVDGKATTITPASNTLSALAQAINSSSAGVTAVILNLGSPTSPDYRLSLQSTALSDENIQLSDGSGSFLQTLTHGSEATYQVDGQPTTPISTSSATVTLAPGLTAHILQAGQTTITVASDPSAAENALSALATAYNDAVSELTLNHGTGGGTLTGQPIISQLEQSLRGLLQYSGGSGSIQSLSDIGLTFDASGQLTFNQGTFESAQASSPSDVSAFLGSATGTGFLATATNTLTALEDPTNGLFATTNNSFQTQITQDTNEINDTEARITTMQATLVAQMSQADAALATLESQLSMLTGLFTATQDAIQANH